jgi:hypothetical protein
VAKSKKNDGAGAGSAAERRARLEQMRAQEKAQSRRRTLLMVTPALILALVVGVMVYFQFKEASKGDEGRLAEIGVAASAAGCQDVVTKTAEGNQDHRDEGEAIEYDTNPPAVGPHWGQFLTGGQIRKFWTPEDRPPVERLVHSLEHGWTILWYDETIAEDDKQVDELKEIAEDVYAGTALEDKVMVAPWTAADDGDRGSDFPGDTHLAFTHWSLGDTNGNPEGQLGVWQYCEKVSGEAVSDFVDDYPYSDSPEPGAA